VTTLRTPDALHPDGTLTGRLLEARQEVVYALEGDLDQAAAGALQQRLFALAEGTVGDLVLDLSRVEFLDSVALRALLRVRRALSEDRRRLVLRDPAQPVLRILQLMLLDDLLNVETTGPADADVVAD
jgi:anti-anti-sigma factor